MPCPLGQASELQILCVEQDHHGYIVWLIDFFSVAVPATSQQGPGIQSLSAYSIPDEPVRWWKGTGHTPARGLGVMQSESESHLHCYWPWALGSVALPAHPPVSVCIKELFVHSVSVWLANFGSQAKSSPQPVYIQPALEECFLHFKVVLEVPGWCS